jgi:osmotically-inducible protein OsmY
VVYLRGEVKRPDEIRKLVQEAGAVDGVRGVENLLHTP